MNNRHDQINKLILDFTTYMHQHGLLLNCLNCHYWKDKEEICGKYNQRPPAQIIVSGCPEHTDIPF